MIGFVVAQVFWIKNSYVVAENDLENKVSNALNDVADHLKSKDIFLLLKESNSPNQVITIHQINDSMVNTNIESWISEESRVETISYQDTSDISIKYVKNELNNGIEIISQFDTLIKGKGETTVTVNNMDFQEGNVATNSSIQSMVQNIIIQYSSEENPLAARLDNINLDSLIKEKLYNRGVNLPFLHGVLDEKEEVLLSEYSTLKKIPMENSFRINLFENDVFELNNKLLLQLNNKSGYIFNQLKLMLFFLIVLTLLMLSTFSLTLRIIWKQKKIDQMKNDFINNMTHEFKTPVATIGLALDALNHDKNKNNIEQLSFYTNLIREENNRINNQVERVLNITRFSDINFPINKVKLNLNSSIQQAIKLLDLQIKNSQTEINFTNCDPTLILFADEDLLEKLWLNLIDNAIKYSKDYPKITISCSKNDTQIIVEIQDEGIGMTQEAQNRIYENFYREQQGDIHTVKGFGLGMSYVKKIIDLHHGKIEIESSKDQGTLIRLILPKTVNNG